MTGLLLAIAILIGYGVGDYANSRASKLFRPLAVLFLFSIISVFLFSGISIVTGFPDFSNGYLFGFLFASFFETTGLILMLKAFSLGKVGVITPITNSYILVTLFILVVFGGRSIGIDVFAAVLLTILGVMALTFERTKAGNVKVEKSVIFALLSIVFFGMSFVMFDRYAAQGWSQNALAHSIASVVVASVYVGITYLTKDPVRITKELVTNKFVYISSFGLAVGFGAFFLSVDYYDSVVFGGAVDAASPLATSFIAFVYDGERLDRRQKFGAIAAVTGVVLLSIFS